MAAPTTTTRSTPAGIRLDSSHAAKIAFNRDADASFWEKVTGVPGVDGGEPIDITTHFNTAWRTMAARTLKTLTPFTVVAAFDPVIYSLNNVRDNLVNQEGSITSHFPDGSKLDFYGYLKGWDAPSFPVDEAQPEITLNIVPTNYDPANRVEAVPVLTEVSGT